MLNETFSVIFKHRDKCRFFKREKFKILDKRDECLAKINGHPWVTFLKVSVLAQTQLRLRITKSIPTQPQTSQKRISLARLFMLFFGCYIFWLLLMLHHWRNRTAPQLFKHTKVFFNVIIIWTLGTLAMSQNKRPKDIKGQYKDL